MLDTLLSYLDAPRSAVFKGIDALSRVGGYDGDEIKGGADALSALGMDPDSGWTKALGFAGDVAADPLTWAGGLAGAKAGKYLRGLIPSQAAEQGAGQLGARGLAEAGKFKEPLRDVATFSNMTVENGRLGANPSGRTALFGNSDVRSRMLAMKSDPNLVPLLEEGVGGFYHPDTRSIVGMAGQDAKDAASAIRHERVHAIIDQAAGTPMQRDLPPLMRGAATLKGSRVGLLQDAGVIADELAAQTLENRTGRSQLQGAMSYLFHPEKNATYTDLYRQAGLSPLVTGAYSSLPGALVAAPAAAGVGSSALARYLGS